MSLFKIVIWAMLLVTILHKGKTNENENLDCIHGEMNFIFELYRLYLGVSE